MKFSIITLSDNRAYTIKLAIKSALTQSYLVFEMITNDDGHKYETGKVIKKYLHNNIIKYVRSKLLNFRYSYIRILESIQDELLIKINCSKE